MSQKKTTSLIVVFFIFVVVLPLGGAEPSQGSIRVQVEGMIPSQGILRAALFDSAQGFPGEVKKSIQLSRAPVNSEMLVVSFENIPPGAYAVSVYQDLNNNQRLDKNFWGVPREPIGFSNNPSFRRGPPSFKESLFKFDGSHLNLGIQLRTR